MGKRKDKETEEGGKKKKEYIKKNSPKIEECRRVQNCSDLCIPGSQLKEVDTQLHNTG